MKLRVSLENLLAAEQVGRWWIVGSSWSGAPMINEGGKMNPRQSSMEGQVTLPMCWDEDSLIIQVDLIVSKLHLESTGKC